MSDINILSYPVVFIKFIIIRVNLGTKSQLKLTILICWTKFPQKDCSWSIAEKFNITIEFCIFELVSIPSFRSYQEF